MENDPNEPHVVPHLDRTGGLAQARGFMARYRNATGAREERPGVGVDTSAGEPQVPWFEADLKEMEALAERASNLKLHYGLCPDEIIPPEAQDPTVWSDKEVNDWFTSGE
jgi:hypothetical protein